jgi:CheY-like chemotaxis protein
MNQGSNPPSGHAGGKGRRRRRGRRGAVAHGAAPQQPGQNRQGQGQGQGQGPGKNRHGRKSGGPRPRRENPLAGGIYTAPMDHSYRALQGNNNGNARRPGRGSMGQGPGKQFIQPDPEPFPATSEATPARIFAFVDDLFFLAKIQETARKINVKVEFVKSDKDLQEKMGQNGDKPSLIIFDLNNAGIKPLTMIPKLKSKLKKSTNIIGFVSHVQGDLKMKAQEAGCDMVLPRSAFSQNLAQLLRRHGAPEELPDQGQQPEHPA